MKKILLLLLALNVTFAFAQDAHPSNKDEHLIPGSTKKDDHLTTKKDDHFTTKKDDHVTTKKDEHITIKKEQYLTSKRGDRILPQAHDIGIGINANPFLDYLGNFFGKTANNVAPTWDFANTNLSISIKRFKDSSFAYRGAINIGYSNFTDRKMVSNRSDTNSLTFPNINRDKENSFTTTSTSFAISFGVEKRKGKTRLQGIYGFELGLSANSGGTSYLYGNALSPNAINTKSVDVTQEDSFVGKSNVFTNNYGKLARITESKDPTRIGFGLRTFFGAEYFIAPKLSIGGEFGWGLGFTINTQSSTTSESIGSQGLSGPSIGTQTIEGTVTNSLILGTSNNNTIYGPSGAIRLQFYF